MVALSGTNVNADLIAHKKKSSQPHVNSRII